MTLTVLTVVMTMILIANIKFGIDSYKKDDKIGIAIQFFCAGLVTIAILLLIDNIGG